MRNITRRWLIAAAVLVVFGCILFAAVMTVYGWDVSALSTETYETNTYAVSEAFDGIRMETDTADIEFLLSSDGSCSVVCYEEATAKHTVKVIDGTLTVRVVDTRSWYDHINIMTETPKITVYLSKTAYAFLSIDESTGDVEIPKGFSFDRLNIEASTGDIRAEGVTAGSMEISLSTGSVTLADIACAGDLSIRVSTGDTNITDTVCGNLTSRGSTGMISMTNVFTEEMISIERSTGDVHFDGCDAAEIYVETDTGDVTGTLLSDKIFLAKSDTGSVDVPESTRGGKCEIITDTGDIRIEIR